MHVCIRLVTDTRFASKFITRITIFIHNNYNPRSITLAPTRQSVQEILTIMTRRKP